MSYSTNGDFCNGYGFPAAKSLAMLSMSTTKTHLQFVMNSPMGSPIHHLKIWDHVSERPY